MNTGTRTLARVLGLVGLGGLVARNSVQRRPRVNTLTPPKPEHDHINLATGGNKYAKLKFIDQGEKEKARRRRQLQRGQRNDLIEVKS